MSSSIWTQCAGDSEVRALRVMPWRAVESQHQVSTRKLVDTLEEQALLEELIERVKPPEPTRGRLHYLLSTPFRYPPLRHGSRFGTRRERGIWYGSEDQRTMFAEVAYYRLLFLEGTAADMGVVFTQLSAFRVLARTKRGVDLVLPPFARFRARIASPVTYTHSQALGRAMREAGAEVFRFPSARDAEGGVNIGVFSPAAFGGARPRAFETWHCAAGRDRVELVRGDFGTRSAFTYPREQFVVNGRLPSPAI